ncbi:MAG: serine/threonine protein kinase [Planctomycetes bacterium]|nr:serine/threonine protein kinase [Planctomycetota bacterium]
MTQSDSHRLSTALRWLRADDDAQRPGAETERHPAPGDDPCVRECRKALPVESVGASGARLSGPSTEFVEQAARRLALVCMVLAAVLFIMTAVAWAIYGPLGWAAPPNLWLVRLGRALLLLQALVVLGVVRSRRLSPEATLHVGLAFQVLGGLAIALPSFHGPEAIARNDLSHLSWLCVWITFFPLVVPAPVGRAVATSVLTASTGPAVFAVMSLRAGAPLPPAQALFEAFAPVYICAGISLVPAWLMRDLGRQVTQARREARRLGSYQLVERLGHGGMGEVWRAEHSMLARPAAVKLVKPELLGAAGGDDEQRTVLTRFEREARATAALRSPHTVSLYDFGVADDGAFYYVMELLEGLDLETLVERYGPAPPARAVHLLAQACDSLAEAHAAGLVHRDVKPANIYACRLGLTLDFVKVLDFGLVAGAKFARTPGSARLTGEGFIVGTPAFMAPEMVSEGEVDARADIYALGCVAYWLLTGKHVFESERPMQVMIDHARTQPLPPSRRFERPLPPALDEVVLACLAKAPAERPQDALELKRRLLAAVDEPWTQERARAWWEERLPAHLPPLGPLDPTRAPRAVVDASRA